MGDLSTNEFGPVFERENSRILVSVFCFAGGLEPFKSNSPVDYVNLLIHGDIRGYLKNVTEYHSYEN
jgi:hypothetical protein